MGSESRMFGATDVGANSALRRWLETVGSHSAMSTVRPTYASSAARALSLLGARPTNLEGRLELESVLGRGGMSIVKQGRQVAMGRHVAVKIVRGQRSDAATMGLLREAWLTGTLEHPNVVPIYDIVLDDAGTPLVVMRRIEGTNWHTLLRDPDYVRKEYGADDPLEWHLRVFIQVANAVAFAHSRGVVHRDIKPENVMVGRFGEVYLVDWGIAVADESADEHLQGNSELAGTPCYLAPEMLKGDLDLITAATDVYLLGASLFEVVTGKPPHAASSVAEVLQRAQENAPVMPGDAPDELRAICMRALATDPAERFQSAEEFRRAVEDFLEHRGSATIAEAAQASLQTLREKLHECDLSDVATRVRIYNLFGECQFGFRNALDQWSGNPEARRGLREATIAVIEAELESGNSQSAATLLGDLDDPPPELLERVDEAFRTDEQRQQELEAYARVGEGLSPRRGRFTRIAVIAGMAIAYSVFRLLSPDLSHVRRIASSLVGLVVIGALALLLRKRLLGTAFNRRIMMMVCLFFVGGAFIRIVAWHSGAPPETSLPQHFLLWLAVVSCAAITLDWRIAAGIPLYAVGYMIVSHDPSLSPAVESSCHCLLAFVGLWIWQDREDRALHTAHEKAGRGTEAAPAAIVSAASRGGRW